MMRQQLCLGAQSERLGMASGWDQIAGGSIDQRLFGVIAQAGHGSNGELPVRYVSDWPVTFGPCQRSEGRTIKPGSPAAFPVVPRRSQQPEAMVAELRDL
jgi:hypothetical protein